MSHTPQHIAQLILARLQGTISAGEEAVLQAWLEQPERSPAFSADLEDESVLVEWFQTYREDEQTDRRQLLLERIKTAMHEPIATSTTTDTKLVRGRFTRRWWWAAAVLFFLVGIGAYLWLPRTQPTQQGGTVATTTTDVAPGSTGAILTLADGRRLVLDSLTAGSIATQNGSEVLLRDGAVQYAPVPLTSTHIPYNTMTTPKGRQFQLRLPDGTQVWLNAASSITYPAAFTGKERKVRVQGEAYFEVAKQAAQPFLVDIDGQETIEVLGTQFNVNAYTDEALIHTTLIEGVVRVSAANKRASTVQLRPGQQAQLARQLTLTTIDSHEKHRDLITVHPNADIAQVVAWKNGLFHFDNMELPAVFRQLARWYNVEIRFSGAVPARRLSGTLSRQIPLSKVLELLGEFSLTFRLDGHQLTVQSQ